MVLAYSPSGGFIEAGCGTLLDLSISGTSASLRNIFISDQFGNAQEYEGEVSCLSVRQQVQHCRSSAKNLAAENV